MKSEPMAHHFVANSFVYHPLSVHLFDAADSISQAGMHKATETERLAWIDLVEAIFSRPCQPSPEAFSKGRQQTEPCPGSLHHALLARSVRVRSLTAFPAGSFRYIGQYPVMFCLQDICLVTGAPERITSFMTDLCRSI